VKSSAVQRSIRPAALNDSSARKNDATLETSFRHHVTRDFQIKTLIGFQLNEEV
jgi:hypothetical protein